MKTIKQTRLGDNPEAPGNCFQACLASILELSIEEVPDELDDIKALKNENKWPQNKTMQSTKSWELYYNRVQCWLAKNFNLSMLEVQYDPILGILDNDIDAIFSGPSPRNIQHAVVAKGPRIVHDPHPDDTGLSKIELILYFVHNEPHKCKLK